MVLVESAGADRDQKFRAACALAAYDPDSPRWARAGPDVAAQLVSENPLWVGQWVEALRPQPAQAHPLARPAG